jgi:hypothetical protein
LIRPDTEHRRLGPFTQLADLEAGYTLFVYCAWDGTQGNRLAGQFGRWGTVVVIEADQDSLVVVQGSSGHHGTGE